MNTTISKVIIVGGGTAGWLTAGILAADRLNNANFEIVLIESPNAAPIGVGEGTWPSMRSTLQRIGISESDFIRTCHASFKQGSQFVGWLHGKEERYYHPFSLPQDYESLNLASHWQTAMGEFANCVSTQPLLCDQNLAPKQLGTPEYASVTNYGYHLDSSKFSVMLQKHCTEKLKVKHLIAEVIAIKNDNEGNIESLRLASEQVIEGDLFIDCSGFNSILLGKHYAIPLNQQQEVLFNDTALAVQLPYSEPNEAIASSTIATAQTAGWIWDIGLPTRRGVGYVYSSSYSSEQQAAEKLDSYIQTTSGQQLGQSVDYRKLNINPGYRSKFWHKNCVAIGLSGGFIEPLEASALVLIELSAKMLSEQFPANKSVMPIIAKRFNDKFTQQWKLIIDFLKLHYVLSKRTDSEYWINHRNEDTMSDRLKEWLELWRYQVPWHGDTAYRDDLFPAASFQYVLYGMGAETTQHNNKIQNNPSMIKAAFEYNQKQTHTLMKALPTNRQLLAQLAQQNFPKI